MSEVIKANFVDVLGGKIKEHWKKVENGEIVYKEDGTCVRVEELPEAERKLADPKTLARRAPTIWHDNG